MPLPVLPCMARFSSACAALASPCTCAPLNAPLKTGGCSLVLEFVRSGRGPFRLDRADASLSVQKAHANASCCSGAGTTLHAWFDCRRVVLPGSRWRAGTRDVRSCLRACCYAPCHTVAAYGFHHAHLCLLPAHARHAAPGPAYMAVSCALCLPFRTSPNRHSRPLCL